MKSPRLKKSFLQNGSQVFFVPQIEVAMGLWIILNGFKILFTISLWEERGKAWIFCCWCDLNTHTHTSTPELTHQCRYACTCSQSFHTSTHWSTRKHTHTCTDVCVQTVFSALKKVALFTPLDPGVCSTRETQDTGLFYSLTHRPTADALHTSYLGPSHLWHLTFEPYQVAVVELWAVR